MNVRHRSFFPKWQLDAQMFYGNKLHSTFILHLRPPIQPMPLLSLLFAYVRIMFASPDPDHWLIFMVHPACVKVLLSS